MSKTETGKSFHSTRFELGISEKNGKKYHMKIEGHSFNKMPNELLPHYEKR